MTIHHSAILRCNQDLSKRKLFPVRALPKFSRILLQSKFHGLTELQELRQQIDDIAVQYMPLCLYIIALHEAMTNALKHGTTKGKTQLAHVSIHLIGQHWFIVRIKDSGSGFNGNERLQQLKLNIEDAFEKQLYQTSGRGLAIMLAASDRICFNRKGNEVLLAKRISP